MDRDNEWPAGRWAVEALSWLAAALVLAALVAALAGRGAAGAGVFG